MKRCSLFLQVSLVLLLMLASTGCSSDRKTYKCSMTMDVVEDGLTGDLQARGRAQFYISEPSGGFGVTQTYHETYLPDADVTFDNTRFEFDVLQQNFFADSISLETGISHTIAYKDGDEYYLEKSAVIERPTFAGWWDSGEYIDENGSSVRVDHVASNGYTLNGVNVFIVRQNSESGLMDTLACRKYPRDGFDLFVLDNEYLGESGYIEFLWEQNPSSATKGKLTISWAATWPLVFVDGTSQ